MASVLLLALAVQDVGALVERLRSDSLEERQAAEDALVRLGEPVLPDLEKRRSTADVETAGRMDNVLYRIRWWERIVWAGSAAVDVDTGKPLWTIPARRLSLVGARDVFLSSREGSIERRSLKDGAILWTADIPAARDLLAAGETILILRANGLQALSAETGKPLWAAGDRSEALQRDIVCSGSRIILLSRTNVRLLDAASGRAVWTHPEGADRAAFLPDGDVVLIDSDRAARLKSSDGSVVWDLQGSRGDPKPGLWIGPRGIVTGFGSPLTDPSFGVIDAMTGRLTWKHGGVLLEAALSEDGKRLFGVKRNREGAGELLQVDLARDEVIQRLALESIPSRLCVQGDRVYAVDHQVSCCGVALRCYDTGGKGLLWKADAQGIPTEHSKYWHRLRCEIRGHRFILAGEASAGDYVEAFRTDTGALISRWRR